MGWGRIPFPPAAADLEAVAPRQLHHGMVVAAVAQGGPHGRIGFAERHKGIQLTHFLQKLLQLRFSHGRWRG
jgi:hypothetical protein